MAETEAPEKWIEPKLGNPKVKWIERHNQNFKRTVVKWWAWDVHHLIDPTDYHESDFQISAKGHYDSSGLMADDQVLSTHGHPTEYMGITCGIFPTIKAAKEYIAEQLELAKAKAEPENPKGIPWYKNWYKRSDGTWTFAKLREDKCSTEKQPA